MDFLDIFFPKYCVNCKKLGDYICSDCFSFLSFDVEKICAVCNLPTFNNLTHPRCRKRYTIDGVFSSISYKGTAKKLIYNFKYNPYVSDLEKLLTDIFYEGLIQKEEFHKVLNSQKVVLVPIPLYHLRERKRGYNHASILAEQISKKLNIPVCKVLERIKNTKTQVNLDKEERKKNLKNAFVIAPEFKNKLKGREVFLVDDVFTTGSTLLEAANTLKRSGVKKVFGLTLARG
ncbi:MAG: hypothetical protein A2958_01380 [Candidatus Levybacteria bacterium RIFCSPLOWO2_01_FULL_38_13]|nr:MAG: hypothetical protein A2629_01240 [Candidatus Levybacteria bacterium RIFCSPHIGHO2_01_FULL_41_15]OGH35801.1 MAG: hypothetical protein A2958_01380 [Candidatus Levybacteria bacterium RIFCSPLOWO2_01_FULL_38_13]